MVPLRPLELQDIDAVLAIQNASPEAAEWDRGSYEAICDGRTATRCIVADADTEHVHSLLGFGCFRVLGPEAELLNLAVSPAARRRGVGIRIVREVMQQAVQAGAAEFFLEVRHSNTAARALYERLGFRLSGTRAGYYANPPGNALIYRLDLLSSAGMARPESADSRLP